MNILSNVIAFFQRFAAFLAPLTSGRVNIAIAAIYSSKVMYIFEAWLAVSVCKPILHLCVIVTYQKEGGIVGFMQVLANSIYH